LYTTGLDFSFSSVADHSNPENPINYGVFSIACLDKNIEKMFDLLGEMLVEPHFKDEPNMTTIIRN